LYGLAEYSLQPITALTILLQRWNTLSWLAGVVAEALAEMDMALEAVLVVY
jgi:hypothetical protein